MAYCIVLVFISFVWLAYETKCFSLRLPGCQAPGLHRSGDSPGKSRDSSGKQLPGAVSKRKPPRWILAPALGLIIILLSPAIFQFIIFRFSGPHPGFDCDDGALLMLRRLSDIGISSTAWIGNLKQTGEAFGDSNHVWIIANILGWKVPFDWGSEHFDKQHYEGYAITYDQLLQLVEQDKVRTD
jgi:hypothetical protein